MVGVSASSRTSVKYGCYFVSILAPSLPPVASRLALCRYAFLQPGAWGRFKGLQVLQTGVDMLTYMGVNVIRWGGTVSQTFR